MTVLHDVFIYKFSTGSYQTDQFPPTQIKFNKQTASRTESLTHKIMRICFKTALLL